MPRRHRAFFGGRAPAAEEGIAVGKPAEAQNHRGMASRKAESEGVAKAGVKAQGQQLVGAVLAVHYRHIEELPLVLAEPPVPAARNRPLADGARQGVAGEGETAVAVQIAGS